MAQLGFTTLKPRPMSLRLTGAEVLRDGELQRRSVALADGRITKGPLPEVDLTGYFILPGIVDLCGTTVQPIGTSALQVRTALHTTSQVAASCGVTTLRVGQGWGWDSDQNTPETALRVLSVMENTRPDRLIDMRAALICDTHSVATRDKLLATVRRHRIDMVYFDNALARIEQGITDGRPFAEKVARAAAEKRDVPRHLCRLAEAFDLLGTIYGSLDDPDGETRETYSMLGAKLCARPADRKAAALAHAVGDPVLLSAPEVLATDQAGRPNAALDLIKAGLCQALMSDHSYAALVPAVFKLVDEGLLPLPDAWNLISKRPADILRRSDRGVIDYGKRADLVIVNSGTRQVEATLSNGRIAHLTGEAAHRFTGARSGHALAAE